MQRRSPDSRCTNAVGVIESGSAGRIYLALRSLCSPGLSSAVEYLDESDVTAQTPEFKRRRNARSNSLGSCRSRNVDPRDQEQVADEVVAVAEIRGKLCKLAREACQQLQGAARDVGGVVCGGPVSGRVPLTRTAGISRTLSDCWSLGRHARC